MGKSVRIVGYNTPRQADKSEGEVPRDPLGAPILIWIFDGFWRSLAPKTRWDRFPVSKSPLPTSGAFVASYLTAVFQKNRKKKNKPFFFPPEALEHRHWYSDLEQALAVNLVKFSLKTVVI